MCFKFDIAFQLAYICVYVDFLFTLVHNLYVFVCGCHVCLFL